MKILNFSGETYQAKKIVKTQNSIIGYNNNQEIFAFRGINDFSAFQLSEGQEWDIDPEAEKDQRIADLEFALAEILGGGI